MFAYRAVQDRLVQQEMSADYMMASGAEWKTTACLAFVTLAESGSIDAVTAAEHPAVFAEWQPGVAYEAGHIRRYGEKLYRCISAHTALAEWTPEATPALWVTIGDPAEEYPQWSQPVGAADAYQIGDKVSYGDTHWVSTAENNVWVPGVYGWEQTA